MESRTFHTEGVKHGEAAAKKACVALLGKHRKQCKSARVRNGGLAGIRFPSCFSRVAAAVQEPRADRCLLTCMDHHF